MSLRQTSSRLTLLAKSRWPSSNAKGVRTTRDIGSVSLAFEDHATHINGAQNERELLDVLRTLLVDTGVEVVAEARIGDHRADFVIWSDVLGTNVGNPLIIEVKATLRTIDAVRQALAQLAHSIN